MVSALRSLGHDLFVLGGPDREKATASDSQVFFKDPVVARQMVKQAAADHKAEALILGDDSSPLVHLGHENLEIPRLWWSIDTHLHAAWHRHLSPTFHHVFTAQRPYGELLRNENGQAAAWLPLFFPEALPFTPWSERNLAVTFVGTVDPARNPRRVAFLKALEKLLPLHVAQGPYRKRYCHSQVVVNQAVAGDLNNRVFEAMGCGSALVTEQLPQGFAEVGKKGRDFLTYPSGPPEKAAQAAAEIILKLLSDGKACEEMARQGHKQVNEKHLAMHRAVEVDKALRATASCGGRASPQARDQLTYAQFMVSRLGYPKPLCHYFKSEALRRATALAQKNDGIYPWSRLVLAEIAVAKSDWKTAKTWLTEYEPPDDAGYMAAFSPLRSVVAAQSGDGVEALYWVRRGLRLMPEDSVLLQMQDKLKLG